MRKKELLKELIISFQQSFCINLKERDIEIAVDSDKIVVLKGVRRSGKSSALHLLIDKALKNGLNINKVLFLNFDDERIPFDTSELDLILQAYRELYPDTEMKDVYFFFDEVQLSIGWEQFVRRIYDNESRHIFITGSNAKMLSSEIASSLRGRTLQYEIFPLSFREYCSFRSISTGKYNVAGRAKLIQEFQNYLFSGGFPELVMNDYKYFEQILQEYYHVMLYRDLLERYEIRNLPALKYFIRRILTNLTKPTSINKIYNELKSAGINVGKNSLYEWIDQLEAVYLFFALPKYDPSFVRENASEKKYYSIDTGFQRALSFSLSKNRGALLENILFLWLRMNSSMNTRLFYYKGKRECDFVITEGNELIHLVQSSWDISDDETYKRELAGLIEASEKLNCNNLWLITAEHEDDIVYKGKTIKIRPAWQVLLEKGMFLKSSPY